MSDLLRGYDPKSSVIFGEPGATLVTSGVFARITTPAFDAHLEGSPLQRELAHWFERAREAGIADPIVVGSVPFDPTKPSSLLIPESHRLVAQVGEMAPGPSPLGGRPASREDGRAAFQHAVRELLDAFKTGSVRKVVLSRALDIALDPPLDRQAFVARLLTVFPTGYRFAVPLADEETLVGVSPELLMRKHGARIASNPLAGSLPRHVTEDERQSTRHLMASVKDLEEHRYVVEQVRGVLRDYCVELSVPDMPSLLRTSFLWHLSTWIEGMLSDPRTNALALASALHPTPAVCGYPTAIARELIGQVEGYDRGLFTGMTGWMNARGDGEWALTIRCAVVRPSTARLFAGAGIVAGSVPELEWEETATKMAPMLHALDAVRTGGLP